MKDCSTIIGVKIKKVEQSSMINNELSYQPSLNWELNLPQSEYADYVFQAITLTEKYPKILKDIEADLKCYATAKKHQRCEDLNWKKRQNSVLPGIESGKSEAEGKKAKLKAGIGRPRIMTAMPTYLFLMSRGYMGAGVKSSEMDVFTREARTLDLILQNLGTRMPKPGTISENINAISESTLSYIMDCQLAEVLELKLDDFKESYIDSTAVSANSCFPKESDFIKKGQRDTVIGYKPQLMRSRNGFITELGVPLGNAADSEELIPTTERSVKRTCCS